MVKVATLGKIHDDGLKILKESKFEIIDISGRIIYTDKCHNSINKINVAHILPGIYYLNIRNGSTKSIYLEKIIIL